MSKKKIDRLLTKLCIYTVEKSVLPKDITDRLSTRVPLSKKQLDIITERYQAIQEKKKSIAKKIIKVYQ